MKLRFLLCLALASSSLLLSGSVRAQDLPEFEIGLKPFGTYHGGSIDSVSITNGNLTIDMPLFSYPQRGGKLKKSLDMIYNNKAWKYITTCNHVTGDCTTRVNWQGSGIRILDPENVPGNGMMTCAGGTGGTVGIPTAPTALGATHPLAYTLLGDLRSIDATGLRRDTISSPLVYRDGTRQSVDSTVDRDDPNGNQINIDGTDTLGRLISSTGVSSETIGCPVGQRSVASAYVISVPGPSGTTSQIKYCNVGVPLATNFGVGTEYSGTVGMIQSIVLYNGLNWATSQAWTFEYDSRSPGDAASINYGDLTKITFPTGGTISYTWTMVPGETQDSRAVATRTVNANDGTGPHTWTYTPVGSGASFGTNTVTDPLGNQSVYIVTFLGNGQSPYVTQVKSYQGSSAAGTLLKTETTDYSYTFTNTIKCSAYGAVFNIRAVRVTTTWPGGKVSKVETDYDTNSFTYKDPNVASTATYGGSYGQVLAVRHYDYGSGTPGALVSQTINTYIAASNPTYRTYNFLDLLYSTTLKDGSGVQKAYTFYGYDESSLQSSGITTQHDPSPVNGNTRGNLTSVHRWLNGSTVSTTNCPVSVSNGYLVSSSTYYDTGTVPQSTDPCGHPTNFLYSSTYAGAYPTTITNALSQSTTNVYDFNTGLLTSTTDPNSQTTSLTYDSLFRLTQKSFPDGGQTVFTYQDASQPFSVTVAKTITSSLTLTAKALMDGVGRVTQAQLLSDPDGNDYIDTTYDSAGRKATASNPYRTTNDPTYGITTSQYDGLSRTTKVIPPDGAVSANNVATVYSDNCTTVTDQAGKIRKSCTDGLGRLVQVFEDSAGLNYETDYTYDALGNLLTVNQKDGTTDSTKWRTRTFVYNSLSQLSSSTNPEPGAVSYAYDADGNMVTKTSPAPNQTGSTTVTTTYAYDALNRLTGKTYSNLDPAVSYTYDQPSCLGQATCFNIGRRTSMTDAGGSQAWAYDKMGRPVIDQRTTNAVTKSTLYTYNLDGSIATITYPSGRTITYTSNAVSRPLSAVDSANAINYATGATYAPQGALSSLTNAGIIVSTMYYNNRLQPCRISMKNSGTAPTACSDSVNVGNVMDLTYNFNLGTADNGNVMGITNNRDTTRSQSFTYDALNRIATAKTTSTSGGNCWDEQFGYDPWANLLSIGRISGYTCSNEELLSVTATTKNQISGNTYDAAGNTTADGVNSYVWNAESQIKAAAGVNYTYDGDGNRVQKSNGKLYWYGAGTEILDETDLAGNLTNEYIYFGGRRIARRDSAGNVYYYMEDFLGSSRVIATAAGSVCYDADFYPFGGERAYTNTCPQNYKFEGKERDAETGNDDFGARYYSSSTGRWLSADWSAIPAPVPYANFTNPQTLNLYAMVRDNPETFADLDGHEGESDAVKNRNPADKSGTGTGAPVEVPQPDPAKKPQPPTQQQPNQAPPKPPVVGVVPGKPAPSANPAAQAAKQLTKGNPKVTPPTIKEEIRPGTSNPQAPVNKMVEEVTNRPEAQRVKVLADILDAVAGALTRAGQGIIESTPVFAYIPCDKCS